MRIVIIGSSGQLGSDCCQLFSDQNEIIGCDIPRIDIGSRESVDSFIDDKKPDVIINCAAFTAVDACESQKELAWKVNADGPGFLAQAAARNGARLIHISTDYVFDGARTPPNYYVETDQTNPVSEYGRSKLAGEKAVSEHCDNHVILRTAWLYSATGKNFLKTMLRLAVADSSRELKVVNDQYGSLTWSYTLARQIGILLDSDFRGIAHTTSEGYSTWYEAARYFLDKMGVAYAMRPCTTAEYPTPATRPANSILENQVLKEKGICVFPDWREDINTFVDKNRDELLVEAKESLQG